METKTPQLSIENLLVAVNKTIELQGEDAKISLKTLKQIIEG